MIGGGAEDPVVIIDDETDVEEEGEAVDDGAEEEVTDVEGDGVEDEEIEEEDDVEAEYMRSAHGGLMSSVLQLGFCSRISMAPLAAEAREPPCALASSSAIVVW